MSLEASELKPRATSHGKESSLETQPDGIDIMDPSRAARALVDAVTPVPALAQERRSESSLVHEDPAVMLSGHGGRWGGRS